MGSQVWVVATLLVSIVLIVLTIVKLKFHPFLALLLASFFVGAMMGMSPLDMVNAIESGIGGTLGFLAAVIGLGTILGKMMEVSGAAERIGIALQRCRWLSADVIMVLVGLICGVPVGWIYSDTFRYCRHGTFSPSTSNPQVPRLRHVRNNVQTPPLLTELMRWYWRLDSARTVWSG